MFLSAAIKATASAGLLLLLGACASPVTPGMHRDEVVSRLGRPPAEVSLESGTRLQYSQQSGGRTALMVDLDASGRVTSARQVLTAAEFARLSTGRWTRADVEREFGRPATIDRVHAWRGDIMAYRWTDHQFNKFFWIYLDENNVVQKAHEGPDEPEYFRRGFE